MSKDLIKSLRESFTMEPVKEEGADPVAPLNTNPEQPISEEGEMPVAEGEEECSLAMAIKTLVMGRDNEEVIAALEEVVAELRGAAEEEMIDGEELPMDEAKKKSVKKDIKKFMPKQVTKGTPSNKAVKKEIKKIEKPDTKIKK